MTHDKIAKLKAREDNLKKWMEDNHPECLSEQKHLVENSPERTYWHYGYFIALCDILRLVEQQDAPAPSVTPDELLKMTVPVAFNNPDGPRGVTCPSCGAEVGDPCGQTEETADYYHKQRAIAAGMRYVVN